MTNIIFLGYFFLGSFSSFLILKNGIKFFEKFFLDNPNKRSLHIKPIPSAGGLSFIIPLLIYDLLFFYLKNSEVDIPLSLFCIPLICISFLDDLTKVSPKYRYFFQLITSILILEFSNISLFVIFLIINYKFNSNISIIILLGSLSTFIFWNWSPAKIFMGDIGSTFLGVYFIATILQFNDINEILGLLLIASPIYGDALITLCRRFLKGQNIFKAHRQHLYQRLHLGKLSKKEVAIIYILLILTIGIVYIKLNIFYEIGTIFVSFFIMNLIEKKYAVSFEEAINNKLI